MDVQSPPDVFSADVDRNAPIHESINTVNMSTSAPFGVEEVPRENIVQFNTVSQEGEDPSGEREKGDISGMDYTLEPESLGAYDQYGNYYP